MRLNAVIGGHKVSGTPEMVGIFAQVSREVDETQAKWCEELRAKGIKAAHPDDGWIDREKNILYLQYPHFDDSAGSGDLVLLGWHECRQRLVRLVEPAQHWGGMGWRFVDAE